MIQKGDEFAKNIKNRFSGYLNNQADTLSDQKFEQVNEFREETPMSPVI
jgi:hypothetical protein